MTFVALMAGSRSSNFDSPLLITVVWSAATRRTVSVNWPMPAVQRLKTQMRPATMGTCGTRRKCSTPMRKRLPLTSWRTSSHGSEHWRSGRIRVACIKSVEGWRLSVGRFFGGADGVLQQHGNRHRADAAGVRRNFAGNGLDVFEIHVADEFRSSFGTGIGNAVHA